MPRILSIYFLLFTLTAMGQGGSWPLTAFEMSDGNSTFTYEEGIAYFNSLAEKSPLIHVETLGTTDAGFPLHTYIWSADGTFSPEENKAKERAVFLVNNAIHPGEPDGVEASAMLLRDLASDRKLQKKYANTTLIIIPFYNIGGVLNRNSYSRANQNGPEEYGFRGNAKNYDLNRDFIKMDSKNAFAFAEIFNKWNPLVFFDNHVSNGADYQYTLTYLSTQEDKLGKQMSIHQRKLNKRLAASMARKNMPIIPYVNVWGRSPDQGGIYQFYDSPRYSSGYAALHQCFAYTVETHMLKPFAQRVEQTYEFMRSMLDDLAEHAAELLIAQASQKEAYKQASEIALNYSLDRSRQDKIPFKGYAYKTKTSAATGMERPYYDKSEPFEKIILYYTYYQASLVKQKPKYYLIPKAWSNIIERLKVNNIHFHTLQQDSSLHLTAMYVDSFETVDSPFEGHYLHYNTHVSERKQEVQFRAGDVLIPTEGNNAYFLMSVLEPEATDSYFNWNFFDIYLQRKEGYSAYVFEDKAAEYLEQNPSLRAEFEAKKKADEQFAKNAQWQLYWIYQHSRHYEPEHNRVPVFKIY